MKSLKTLTILGGGTSAWLAAAYFRHNLPSLKICVVDKEKSEPVGVGEGTLMNFRPFLDNCGISFEEWFVPCGATLKAGILFKNWKEIGKDIWHPFLVNPSVDGGFNLHDVWSNHQDKDFKIHGTGLYDLSVAKNLINKNVDYAYHVDCGKLVRFLKERLINNGVHFIDSEMIEFFEDSNNEITHLVLKNGEKIQSDLYIDCTGFKALLNKAPDTQDLQGRLFCNTALAGHIPYIDRRKELNPYVISEAVDHGWIWNIPVNDRIGSGLVFNRDITDPNEAAEFFVKYWDNRITVDNLKLIDWTPFYNKNMWHGNVISIGLSAGFIEPLESTGIALIMEGIYQATNRIADYSFNDLDKEIFNLRMISFFDESIDFVNMHYYDNTRSTDFWNFVSKNHSLNNKHKHYLEILNNDTSIPVRGKDTNFFTLNNWMVWLIQMGATVKPRTFVNSQYEKISELIIDNFFVNHTKFNNLDGINHADEIDRIHYIYSKQ